MSVAPYAWPGSRTTCTRREQRGSRETDNRRFQSRSEADVADGPQQILPPGCAETVRQPRDCQREQQQLDARERNLGTNLTEVSVAKE